MLVLLAGFTLFLRALPDTPSDTARTYTLDEALVTRSPKEHMPLMRQPQSASTFMDESLARRGVNAPKDLSALAPNLYMPTYGSRLTSAVYVRGVGSRSGSPAVGLYVDNIPYADKSMYDLELSDVDGLRTAGPFLRNVP